MTTTLDWVRGFDNIYWENRTLLKCGLWKDTILKNVCFGCSDFDNGVLLAASHASYDDVYDAVHFRAPDVEVPEAAR